MPFAKPTPFGVLVRYYRQRAGLTQQELAARCQCTKSYISAIETGKPPSHSDLPAIARALDLGEADRRLLALAWRISPARLCAPLEGLSIDQRLRLLWAVAEVAGPLDDPPPPTDIAFLKELYDAEARG